MMRRVLPLIVSLCLVTPAAAQLRAGDSLAVTAVVRRYHAALEAGDTAAAKSMLAPGARVLERGSVRRLEGETLRGQIRVAQAMSRTKTAMAARVLGWAAYVYSTSDVEARSRPDLFSGVEVESVVLSRLGDTWFIEIVHTSNGNR